MQKLTIIMNRACEVIKIQDLMSSQIIPGLPLLPDAGDRGWCINFRD